MTLRHLYIFIAVYQEMSITKAAERLHLAQPRVSQAVKELEEEYGVRLFERLNRKLFVTEKGERLYDYAVHLLELSQEMEEDLLSSGNGGRIRLGSSITAGAFLVPERAARFQEHYPECRLEVSVQNSGKVIRQVLKNELDLGVIEDRAEEEMLVKIPFREDRLYFLCGASHPLAEKEAISLDDLEEYPYLSFEQGEYNSFYFSEEILSTLDRKKNIKVRDRATLFNLVIGLNGYTVSSGVISKELNGENIIAKPLLVDEYMKIGTITQKNMASSRYGAVYMEALRHHIDQADSSLV